MANRLSYSDFFNKGYRLNNGVLEKVVLEKKIPSTITSKQFNDGYRTLNDTIVFNINPIGKPRMTSGDKSNYRPITKKYWDYKAELNRLAAESNYVMGDKLDVEFHIAMPTSWSSAQKEKMNGQPHDQTPDSDNMYKALTDCLKKEDKTIWWIKIIKCWSHSGKIIINR